MTESTRYYWVQLGAAALQRGDRVLCEVLKGVGTGQRLVKTRIVRSTLPAYPVGKTGVMQRDRLVPVRHAATVGAVA